MVKVLDLDQKCRRFDTLALVEVSSYVSFLTVRRKVGEVCYFRVCLANPVIFTSSAADTDKIFSFAFVYVSLTFTRSAADSDTLALVELSSYVSFLTVQRKVGAVCC